MKLTDLSIKRPVSLTMATLAVVFLGIVSFRQMSVDLLPDLSYPRFSVVTLYPGAAPEEIESLLAVPLEAAVSLVPGVRRIESVSREGVCRLTLEFSWGTDMDLAMLHSREKLDGVRHALPEGAGSPTIVTIDPLARPILVLAVSGGRGLLELKEFAEELVKPRLEQVAGLGSAEVTGGVERQIRVDVNPGLLSLYGLTVDDVALRIDAANQSLQGGTIRQGPFQYALRVAGEFETVEEIGEISLKVTAHRGVVRLKDVARVMDAVKERRGATRLDGREAVGILVRKEYGANTVRVTKLARSVIDQIAKEYPEVHIRIVSEQSKTVERAIGAVTSEIVQGAVLAFLILFVFLQEWRTPLIIDTVIPVSVIAAINLLHFSGVTLNIMSLGGLALGVGMLDDCAVVVSENIFRHRGLGKGLPEAARDGAAEVGPAVTATALTTVVVFLPVIYVQGVAGRLFRDEALSVTFSLLGSLLVSLTLLPMLHSRRFRVGTAGGKAPFPAAGGVLFDRFNAAYAWFVERYLLWLRWSLDRKRSVISISLAFFTAALAVGFVLPRENMPKMPASAFELSLKTPVDCSFEQTDKLAAAVESGLRADPGVKATLAQVGIVSGLESLDPEVSENSARIFVEVGKPSDLEPVLEGLRPKLAAFPGLSYAITREESPLAQVLAFSGAEVGLKVTGEDLGLLEAAAEELARRLKQIPGIVDVVTTVGEGRPGFLVRIKAAALEKHPGVSPAEVGGFITGAVRGRLAATQLREFDKKYDILVRPGGAARRTIESLFDEEFPDGGSRLPLRELATYELVRGPREIRRADQRRQVVVSANLRGTKLSRVAPAIDRAIAGLDLPPGCRISAAGEREEMGRSFRSLALALLLAGLLTYMIMAAQFESLLHPFLVMFTLPMGAAGAVLSLLIAGQSLNAISIIGLVVLVGLVVDDAIVEIDAMNRLRRNGAGLRRAVEEACRTRLRPILMASLSTVFGVIPMASGLEPGAELLQPLGVVVLGGLLLSTLLTLILIPVLYEWAESRRRGARC